MLVYSGSHRTDIEVDQKTRDLVFSGIHDERFSWKLDPGAAFTTPEVLLACAPDGLTALSQHYQQFIRRNICRSPFRYTRRPVLINNWEATYFQFTTDTICQIAEKAASLAWR